LQRAAANPGPLRGDRDRNTGRELALDDDPKLRR
jgi:hypothetical protein